jgi:hypothetical protein
MFMVAAVLRWLYLVNPDPRWRLDDPPAICQLIRASYCYAPAPQLEGGSASTLARSKWTSGPGPPGPELWCRILPVPCLPAAEYCTGPPCRRPSPHSMDRPRRDANHLDYHLHETTVLNLSKRDGR